MTDKVRTIALASASFLCLMAEGGVVLAQRDCPPAFTIVTSESPSACERYAAEELRDYVERTTGVRLPVAEKPVPAKRAIRLGAAALSALGETEKTLGEDGFRILERDGDVFVAGSPKRGVLYGVYELLERFAGIRWYASWHQVVPQRDALVIPTGHDQVEKPAFAMREPFWYDLLVHPEFAARLRVNSRSWRTTEEKFGGSPFRFGGGACELPHVQYADAPGRVFRRPSGVFQL